MDKQGKVWGETTRIFSDQRVEVHFLNIRKGGYCSEHKHAWKTNMFYVIDGELLVRFWRKGNKVDETVLRAGESMNIPIHIWHQFVGLTDCRCIEIYETGLWTADIERRVEGGSDYDKIRGSKKSMAKSKLQKENDREYEESMDFGEEKKTGNENEGKSLER